MTELPVGILLAAGQSRRFGSNKLLHHTIDDTPMLLVSARKLVSVLPHSVVVINEKLQSISRKLESLGMQVVVNEQAEQGMGSSIACGVAASSNAVGWLIALADMPYIKESTTHQLVTRMQQGAGIVAPECDGQRGHPVGFATKYQQDLLNIQGDCGARVVLEQHQSDVVLLQTDDNGVLIDVDQPD